MKDSSGFYEIDIECKKWEDQCVYLHEIPRVGDFIKTREGGSDHEFEVIKVVIDFNRFTENIHNPYNIKCYCELHELYNIMKEE